MGKKFKNVGKGLSKAITVPAIAAATGLFALVQSAANAGDEIQKMALRTGFSTEALSEFKHAAELSGSSIESVEKGVKRMQKMLFDAEKGLSTSKDALAALNLSFEDLRGLSPEEQFSKLSMAIADIEDPSRRAALAQEVFGKAGTELLPMLASGSEGIAAMRQEARDLGIVFSQDAADASAKFNDDLDRLKKGFGGVFKELAMNLMPMFTNKLLPAIKDNLIPMMKRLAERIQGVFEWFANLSPKTQKFIGIAIALTAALGPVLIAIGMLTIAIGATIIPMVKSIAKATILAIKWAFLGTASKRSAIKVVASWAMTAAAALKNTAVMVAQSAVMVAKWVWMGVQSLAQAARMAAAWIIAMGPIAWITVAVIAIAALIIANWDKIKAFTIKIWSVVSDFFEEIWSGIKSGIKNAAEWVVDKFDALMSFFSNLPGKVAQAAKGMWDGIKDSFRGMLNKIIGWWNDFDVSLTVPTNALTKFMGLAGKGFTLRTPNIPMLAEGTNNVPQDMFAMLHEGEGVVPKKYNNNQGNGGPVTIIVEMDGRQIAKGSAPHIVDLIRLKTGVRI